MYIVYATIRDKNGHVVGNPNYAVEAASVAEARELVEDRVKAKTRGKDRRVTFRGIDEAPAVVKWSRNGLTW